MLVSPPYGTTRTHLHRQEIIDTFTACMVAFYSVSWTKSRSCELQQDTQWGLHEKRRGFYFTSSLYQLPPVLFLNWQSTWGSHKLHLTPSHSQLNNQLHWTYLTTGLVKLAKGVNFTYKPFQPKAGLLKGGGVKKTLYLEATGGICDLNLGSQIL